MSKLDSVVHNEGNINNIPYQLRIFNNWCISGPDKIPMYVDYDSGELLRASSIDPNTWMSFDRATDLAHMLGMDYGFMLQAGIGITCIDLDFVDGETQAAKGLPVDPSQWTTQAEVDRYDGIMRHFNTYTELSRSGKGLHIWCLGEIGAGRRRDRIEVYSQERYMICTGRVVMGAELQERQELLNTMIAEMGPAGGKAIELVEIGETDSDEVLWNRAATAYNDYKFKELCSGQWKELGYKSQSEADLALMSMFTFYSASNEQCKRMFRRTVLGQRAKATKNDTYLNRTLQLIRTRQERENQQIHNTTDALFQSMNFQLAKNDKKFQLLNEDDLLSMPPLRWLVKDLIPERSIGSIYGPSGSGKSFLVLDLLAHIGNGAAWFGHKVKQAPVLYIPLEGQAGIPKRIQAWQQHQKQCYSSMQRTQIQFMFDGLNLLNKDDLNAFATSLQTNNWKEGVICIDTLAQSAPGADENSGKEMAPVLAVMQSLQKTFGCVVIAIHHTGKIVELGMRGWSGLHAAMDFAFECQLPSKKNGNLRTLSLQKVKDGQNGREFPFTLKSVFLYNDEEGDPVFSNVISYQPAISSSQSMSDVDQDKHDDDFIYDWVKKAVDSGKHPSVRSIKADSNAMKVAGYKITQIRIGNAIERLLSANRLYRPKEKSPNGNSWISYVPEPIPENEDMDSTQEMNDSHTDQNDGDNI